jgi:hypothetical protein
VVPADDLRVRAGTSRSVQVLALLGGVKPLITIRHQQSKIECDD